MQIDTSFWNQIKVSMKSKNGSNRLLENYLDPIDIIKIDKKENLLLITLGVPNRFFYFYANENLKDKIIAEVQQYNEGPVEIDFFQIALKLSN